MQHTRIHLTTSEQLNAQRYQSVVDLAEKIRAVIEAVSGEGSTLKKDICSDLKRVENEASLAAEKMKRLEEEVNKRLSLLAAGQSIGRHTARKNGSSGSQPAS